jgi:flagellar basal body-associated protein FliL
MKKWFVVGFTAFLAGLTDCHGNNGGGGGKVRGEAHELEELIYFPRHAQEWFYAHPGWVILIIFGVILLLILALLFAWLGSRGKFMFLDNIVHDRAQVAKPWYEFRHEGNSLFLWSILFGFFLLLIFGSYLLSCYSTVLALYEYSGEFSEILLPVARMVLGLTVLIVLTSFVELLVVDFVVPIMYRSRTGVFEAMGVFLSLFGSHIFSFIGYGLFTLGVWILIAIGIIVAAVVTCCIGLLFLVIPYISSVVLLPVSYTMRAFSVEFLEQFGTEYQLFPRTNPGGVTGELPQS